MYLQSMWRVNGFVLSAMLNLLHQIRNVDFHKTPRTHLLDPGSDQSLLSVIQTPVDETEMLEHHAPCPIL